MPHAKINTFGRYPGRFRQHTIEYQASSVAETTLHSLLTNHSFITRGLSQQLARDYDTASDSEAPSP